MGQWLKINGVAIYKTKPWKYQVDSKQKNLWLVELLVNSIKNLVFIEITDVINLRKQTIYYFDVNKYLS